MNALIGCCIHLRRDYDRPGTKRSARTEDRDCVGWGDSAGGCLARAAADQAGITLYGKQTTLFVPFSRMGFWTCILAALVVTALVVFRAFVADIGWDTLR